MSNRTERTNPTEVLTERVYY